MEKVCVIVAAAGASSRMGGINKIRALLGGVPVIVHSMRAFEPLDFVCEIIPVCRVQDADFIREQIRTYKITKAKPPVTGGANRVESVLNGLAAADPAASLIAVHDGARPLVEQQVITLAAKAASRYGAAMPGVAVKDTIKMVNAEGFVGATPDRARLFAAQTPQVFRRALFEQAAAAAAEKCGQFTDDCQMVEQIGARVFVTAGSEQNIKITTPGDLAVAAALLREREANAAQTKTTDASCQKG